MNTEYIHKKIASLEIIRVHHTAKIIGYCNLGGVLTVLLAYTLSKSLGLTLACVLCIINGLYVIRARTEIQRLTKLYISKNDKPALENEQQ
jgi:hypothetical protein